MGDSQTSQVQRNKDLVQHFFTEIYARLAPETILSHMTDGVVFELFGNEAVMDADGLRLHLRRSRDLCISEHCRKMEVEIRHLIGEDDYVLADVMVRGRIANGTYYEGAYMFLVQVAGGKISYVCQHANILRAMEAFGERQVGSTERVGYTVASGS